MGATQSPEILESLKRAAAALRDAEIEFALGGGLAAWARGGPPTVHDIDFLVRPHDVDRARDVMERAGMRTDMPPEGWLAKAWDGDILIDLLFAPSGTIVDDAFFARCDMMNVAAVRMLVMPIEDLFIGKLLAITEHHLEFAPILEMARALREQVDWDVVREQTTQSAFARAFFALLRELGVVDVDEAVAHPAPVVVVSAPREGAVR